jgi:molybdopterin molybdotransferase
VRRNDGGGLDLFANQSSGVLTSAVWAHGLVDNAPSQAIRRGDTVGFLPMDALIGR